MPCASLYIDVASVLDLTDRWEAEVLRTSAPAISRSPGQKQEALRTPDLGPPWREQSRSRIWVTPRMAC